jgi:hypothetical protein
MQRYLYLQIFLEISALLSLLPQLRIFLSMYPTLRLGVPVYRLMRDFPLKSLPRLDFVIFRGSGLSGKPRMQREAGRPERNVGLLAENHSAAVAA